MRELTIAGHRIADDTPAWVIAEVGHNHGGSVETCKAIFKAAADAGADAVKLQKRDNQSLFTKEMYESPYNSEHAFGPTYGAHREALEFGWEQYVELKAYAESLGLVFFATAFDNNSAEFLNALGCHAFKIASGCLTDLPLIRHVASFGKPMIISTGGGTLADVERVYCALGGSIEAPIYIWRQSTSTPIAFLQCTATYPPIPEEMNLRVIDTYRQHFPNTVIGLSDHYDGISEGIPAFMLGARIFEKHFTLSRSWKGSDHAFSLEPEGLRRFIRDLRILPAMLGDGVKKPYPSEAAGMRKMAKGIVVTDDFPAGHVLAEGDLALKSPGAGIEAWKVDKLYGRQLREPLSADQVITTSGVVEPQ